MLIILFAVAASVVQVLTSQVGSREGNLDNHLSHLPNLQDRDTPVKIPLEVFQVQAPVRQTYDGPACTQTVVQKDFANSYGSPFIGIYTAPPDCTFTTVVFNMSITSSGINFDRLALLYLDDIEVWRSTTGMPVRTGIYYNYLKDMTAYASLLHSTDAQKVIMQLDNIQNDVFTGNFNVTIEALYYNDATTRGTATVSPADLILPISSQNSSQNVTSVISLPDSNATVSLAFPRNVERAVVSIFASGNGNEEFWFSDVPAEFDSSFGNGSANFYGYSSWREVQLLIDGQLAGVSWPFPVIFTGLINTGLWVPITGVDAYDLGSVDVDVSPWLGVLCDGGNHIFELRVVGYNSATLLGTTSNNWFLSGQVFLWLDEGGDQTTGGTIQANHPDPTFQLSSSFTTLSNGTNTSMLIELSAQRTLGYTSNITTSSGTRTLSWTQDLSYTNIQNFTARGFNETLYSSTNGTHTFSPPSAANSNSSTKLATSSFQYPVSFYQAYIRPTDQTVVNSTLIATLDRSKITSGDSVLAQLTYPPTSSAQNNVPMMQTRQNGSCFYLWNNTYYENAGAIDPAIGTTGATDQAFSWAGYLGTPEGLEFKEFSRVVSAVDGYEPVLLTDVVMDSVIAVPDTVVVQGDGINKL